MTSLSKLGDRSPFVSLAFGVALTFCCSAPLVWLVANLLVNGAVALSH